MTKQQIYDIIKQWNIEQSTESDKREAEYHTLCNKYLSLNGSRSCSFAGFLIEISQCEKISENERMSDINKIIKYHESNGRYFALSDLISKIIR